MDAPAGNLAAVRDFEYRISPGIEGIRETMALMRSIVKRSRADPDVIAFARKLTAHLPPKDWVGQIRAIFRFVRDRIRYTLDPNDVETLSTPLRLLRLGQGDCDDKAVLLAALLEAIGHPARFKAVGFQAGALSHVYVETKLDGGWIPLDATELGDIGDLAFPISDVKEKWIVHI